MIIKNMIAQACGKISSAHQAVIEILLAFTVYIWAFYNIECSLMTWGIITVAMIISTIIIFFRAMIAQSQLERDQFRQLGLTSKTTRES